MRARLNHKRHRASRAAGLNTRARITPSLSEARALAPSRLKLKTILVPIDFSETCVKALRYATPFAEHFGATLCLVHVAEPSVSTGDLPFLPELSESALVEEARKRLFSLAEKEVEEFVTVKVEVRIGRPDVEIVSAARRLDADLIIISTHGYSGLKHLFMGSTAEKVVQHAPCPVLVVRKQERDFVL